MSGALSSYAVGVAGVALVAAAWLGVQLAWRRVFRAGSAESDALAGRTACHGCGCTVDCEGRPSRQSPTEEDAP